MHVDEQRILDITRDLWTTQLGLNLGLAGAAGTRAEQDRTLASCVKISGTWQGTILLECSESVARHAAAMLFAADAEAASDEDVLDALGELADMFARKLRPLLPEESQLSRSEIIAADESLPGMRGVSELRLSCEGRPVRIALFEGEPEPAPTA